jgi:hypothetical protein
MQTRQANRGRYSDGCGQGRVVFKWEKDPKLSWEDPGYAQTARDPVVCVS